MQNNGRIAPSACTLTLYGANGHVTPSAPRAERRANGTRWATPMMAAQNWTLVMDKIIERERVSRDGSQAQLPSPGKSSAGDDRYWASGGADVWLVQIRAA